MMEQMKGATGILEAAEFGLNLFNARAARRSARETRRLAVAEDRLRQTMISRQARVDTAERQERLREATGSQRAALGSMGVAGGRTARLFQQQAQLQFRRSQDMADAQTSMQRRQSTVQRFQTSAAARRQGAQAMVDLFGQTIGQGQRIAQTMQQGAVG